MLYDVIIIGKGPAGISAGLYVKRAGFKVLVIGKDGGALEKTKSIDNYYGFTNTISGKELLLNGINQAKRLGINIETDEVVGLEFGDNKYIVKTRNNRFEAKCIILATGASRKTPNIRGIKEFEGKGVSYCAVCDAFFYRNRDVSILGSGDYALEEANTLLPVVKSVSILTNGETLVENRSINYDNFSIKEEKIEEIIGEDKVTGIKFKDGKIIDTEGLFVAVGVASSTDLARKLGVIIKENNIIVDENMATNVPRVFACGDCTGGLLQISKAVYEGAIAGLSVIKHLRAM
ncbi:MAG: NAD(P)/FAD-dependent oxidoreductase [Clostridia bacterium]|nr:NAD(P)/FAD-dependent oxidoreductase [Clostridia bacterium]